MPYADNLNVAGTYAARVQQVKDAVVKQLRSLGLRVHEEMDAHHTCQSLGFMIDGIAGTVFPIQDVWARFARPLDGWPSELW